VTSTDAVALLRAYYVEVADRYGEVPAYNDGPYAQIWYGKELLPA